MTPNQMSTDELELTEQLTKDRDTDSTGPVADDERDTNVATTMTKAVEQITRHSGPDVSESESSEIYPEPTWSANGQRTSFEIAASGKRPTVPYQLKQKWEGHVLEVGRETFRARLTPLVGEPGEHIANIYLEEVDKAERDLVEPGSIFYWSIGYRDLVSGRRRESFIRFQRLPNRSEREIETARRRGEELLQLLSDG